MIARMMQHAGKQSSQPKFIHPAELDSASTLGRTNSAIMNPEAGEPMTAPPGLMIDFLDSEPMSPDSQAMLDRDAEVQKEMGLPLLCPSDDISKFHERNVDPNMNGYKIVFMRHRPQKIHEYSEDYVCKRNPLSQYKAYPSFEARMRTLFTDPIKFECCEKMTEPKSAEIILIEKP